MSWLTSLDISFLFSISFYQSLDAVLWYALKFSMELSSKLLLWFFYSIYWTNQAKIKLIIQSRTLNLWTGYPNPTFLFFWSHILLSYLFYIIYLLSTEPKCNTLSKNPNHYYIFEEKFVRTISFFQCLQTICDKISSTLIAGKRELRQYLNFWPFGKYFCHWL